MVFGLMVGAYLGHHHLGASIQNNFCYQINMGISNHALSDSAIAFWFMRLYLLAVLLVI
jgi:hypothetical protein